LHYALKNRPCCRLGKIQQVENANSLTPLTAATANMAKFVFVVKINFREQGKPYLIPARRSVRATGPTFPQAYPLRTPRIFLELPEAITGATMRISEGAVPNWGTANSLPH
jgi:hypothetical protein